MLEAIFWIALSFVPFILIGLYLEKAIK